MGRRSRQVAVIATLDGFANSKKALLIRDLLTERGHAVTVIDTMYLSRASSTGFGRALPSPNPKRLLVYLVGVSLHSISRLQGRAAARVRAFLCLLQMRARGRVVADWIASSVRQDTHFDVVICESQADSALMLHDIPGATKIYNCATPLAEELYFGGELTQRGYEQLKAFEIDIFRNSHHLSFHWHSYAEYVRKYYEYDATNIFTFDRNAEITDEPARFDPEPRIVYMGYLGGYWINLELLSELTRLYPRLDVYGLPEPPSKYGLNYKGYGSVDQLQNYQFGLITSSSDRLRCEGFSAKHIDYLAAGLPVLVPEWRTSARDLQGTIFYTADNFLTQLRLHSDEDSWTRASEAALDQARQYSPDKVAQELIEIVEQASR
jgi:hypothetical protein